MIRNYNVLSGSRDTRLKNRSVIDVDIPTTSITSKSKKPSAYVGWLVAFLLMFGLGANAQVSSYGFSESAGTYTPITGGVVVATATGASGVASLDDNNYTLPAGTIPFTFTYDGVGYTGFNLNSNGFISFGTASAGATYTPISGTGTYAGAIAAIGGDLNALFNINGNTGEIRYETVGSEFVIQYSNFRPFSTSTSTTLYWRWNFQIRLHSDGTIRFVYDTSFVGAVTASTRQVGLRGPNNTFATNVKNRLITNGTHTWDTSVAGTVNSSTCGFSTTNLPTSGKTFIFSPPGPCTGTPVAGSIPATLTGVCAGSTLTVTGQTSGATGITYTWQESDDDGVGDAWAAAVGGTGANTATYGTPGNLNVNRYYRCLVGCSSVGGGSAPTNSCFVSSLIICQFDVAYTTATFTSIMPANGGSGTVFSAWQNTSGDDNSSTTQSLAGTTFTYQGNAITGFQASSNGWMTFNTANTSTSFTNNLASTTPNRVLAPFWEDLVFTGQAFANRDSSMRYQVQGTLGSGSAVIVVEWAGIERFNIAGPNMNFQVRLYEAGNVIEYVYGRFEGFDGTVTSAYSYSIGYNGATPAGTTASDRFGMQTAVTNHFAASDPTNHVVMPACNTKFVFTPGSYTGPVVAPTIPAPSNDNSAGAVLVDVNASPCVAYCNTYYTSRSATNSAFGVSTCATTAGNEDDDVWFKFETTAASDYLIRLRSSPGYDGVLELLNSSFTSILCVNATGAGLIETINATGLVVDGDTYYIRVYHNGATIGASSGQFSLCVSEVILPPSNDNIGGAINVVHASSCTPTNSILPATLAATASPQPVCGGIADDDVWYQVTLVSSEVTLTVQSGGGYNAHVEVFTSSDNTATGTLTTIPGGCVNVTSTGSPEVLNITGGTVGVVLFVRVYHSAAGAGTGNFSICATFPPTPACVATPTPADAATGVTACPSTNLSWEAISGATNYDVYFDVGAGPAITLLGNVTTTTINTGLLSYNSQYAWRVVPKNGTGAATGCATFTFTTGAQAAGPTVTPASPVTIPCGGSAVLLSVGLTYTNPTPGPACLDATFGEFPFGAFTPATCDGTFVNTITTAGYTGEYSTVNVNAGSLYTFTSSIAGDLVAITSGDGLTTYAYGASPVTWYNDISATSIRFYSQKSDCTAEAVNRVRSVVCQSGAVAIFSPNVGLFTDAAATIAYDGVTPVGSIYALPSSNQTYSVSTQTGICTSLPTSVTVNLGACSSIVNLKLFVEGYYTGASTMRSVNLNQGVGASTTDVETITVELHNSTAPYALAATTTAMLQTNGDAVATFSTAPTGNFYVVVFTRNAIETWSAGALPVGGTPLTFDFSSDSSNAYGDNMKDLGAGVWGFYSGDIDPTTDGNVDTIDYPIWETDSNNFASGPFTTDLNGDGNVDTIDYPIWEANSNNFVSVIRP